MITPVTPAVIAPTRTVPSKPAPAAANDSAQPVRLFMTLRSKGSKSRQAKVGRMPRACRSNKRDSSTRSTSSTIFVAADWLRPICAAACCTLPSSATSTINCK
ncbi:hypothetical protein D3C73_1182690 [compost metagenome]